MDQRVFSPSITEKNNKKRKSNCILYSVDIHEIRMLNKIGNPYDEFTRIVRIFILVLLCMRNLICAGNLRFYFFRGKVLIYFIFMFYSFYYAAGLE